MDKKLMKETINQWKNANLAKEVSKYAKQVEIILSAAEYDIARINKKHLEDVRKSNGWVERYKWPITAWNSFCRYGMEKYPDLFNADNLISRHKHIMTEKLPMTIEKEIAEILNMHIVRNTLAKLKHCSQKRILTSFQALYNYCLANNKYRKIFKLSDFNENDVQEYKDSLIRTQLSPLTGQIVSYNILSRFLSDLRSVYKIGVEHKRLQSNIFKEIKIESFKSPKRQFCLSKEQVEKLRHISSESIEGCSLYERFCSIRNTTMISVQYEAALRAEEVVKLCWEDVPKYERSNTNVGPVVIRGSKARPATHEDRVYILFDRLDKDLKLWKNISEEYCKQKNIQPPEIAIGNKLCHPIFYSQKGKILNSGTYISSIFASQLVQSKLELPSGYKSHILRHSKITHWVNDGCPFEKVHENARHSDLKMTWNYFHSNAKNRIEAVEKAEGIDKESRNLKISILPPKGALRTIIDIIHKYHKDHQELQSTDELTPEILLDIETQLQQNCLDVKDMKLYYTFRDVVDKWGLGRTQTYERLKILTKQGVITPIIGKNSTQTYFKEQIDYVSTLVDSRKASVAFGYNEKVPTTIPGLANKGVIRSVKIGKLHHFNPAELVDHFFEKNS